MAIDLDPAFGYVGIVALASWFIHNGWMSSQVMAARKKYNVNYPALYASAENSPNASAENRQRFNCVQRAHQNSLENLANFNLLLLIAGLKYPVTAATAGAVYVLGRIFYFRGYATGDPQKRMQGTWMYFGLLGLLGSVGKMAFDLLRR